MYSEDNFDNNWEDSVFTEYAIIESLWEEYEKEIEMEKSILNDEIEDYISINF